MPFKANVLKSVFYVPLILGHKWFGQHVLQLSKLTHSRPCVILMKNYYKLTLQVWLCVCVCLLPGCGEHLIRTMLARECSAAIQSEDAHQALLEAMQNKFISESPTCSLLPTLSLACRFVSQERVCEK